MVRVPTTSRSISQHPPSLISPRRISVQLMNALIQDLYRLSCIFADVIVVVRDTCVTQANTFQKAKKVFLHSTNGLAYVMSLY